MAALGYGGGFCHSAQVKGPTMTQLSATRTYSHDGPICPYCGRKFVPDDPAYYDEQRYIEQNCDDCYKTFKVEVYHSTSWTCDAIED